MTGGAGFYLRFTNGVDSFTVSGSTLTFASNLSTGDVIDFVMVFGRNATKGLTLCKGSTLGSVARHPQLLLEIIPKKFH